ncbi:unnamed protein product [Bursaphelenchus xylophilus]|uniref:(pine wood nematode) hypothetical protein n=1 Tax=Bursaphelenchus xylophilus TaxID=6326 RepID=A0A1I7SH16_BURXY|nr:unnamed protein product [Bursaphelenchus xylophilus]CAG9117520.1 unnamed protein product [Bursaphelenchus xylophilus]
MLSKVRSVISPRQASNSDQPKVGLVVDMADSHLIGGIFPVGPDKEEYPYSRPEFLHFTEEDVALALDQQVRPVLCPKFPNRMPAVAGYAECCNAGKSTLNEDQAAAKILQFHQQGYEAESMVVLNDKNKKIKKEDRKKSDEDVLSFSPSLSSDDSPGVPEIKAAYFGLFDGHAGSGAASISANCLHEHIKNRMNEVVETVLTLSARETHMVGKKAKKEDQCNRYNSIDSQSLIIGALEKAFLEMDNQIVEEKQYVRIGGGCAVLVSLFCLNKIFIANAGDCRAIVVTPREVRQLSEDMTPVRERKRLQFLAYNNEDALNNSFSRFEYSRFLTHKDLGRKVLYRDYNMDGWTTKTVKEYDLRPPLISTRSKKARLLNTIGVSRGFGDHHLMTYDDKISIKPFLTASPEVTVFDLSTMSELTDSDVLIMASDGLWDVLSNEDVAKIVRTCLSQTDPSDLTRYTSVAQDLAAAARGNPMEGCKWRLTWNKDTNIEHIKESPATSSTSYGTQASLDDITVFVIPLKFAINLPRDDDDEDDEELLVF